MSYPNAYLRDFVPVLGQILKEKQIAPEKLHLEIIDEESEEKSIFEPVGVDEVLDQLGLHRPSGAFSGICRTNL